MTRFISAVFQNCRRTLFAIFMAALLVRAIFILTLQDGFYFLDSVAYSKAAVNLLTSGELGGGYDRPPGYPVFLMLTMLLACSLFCFPPVDDQEVSPKRAFLAGALWGLATLTKPIVLATIVPMSPWATLDDPRLLQVWSVRCRGAAPRSNTCRACAPQYPRLGKGKSKRS